MGQLSTSFRLLFGHISLLERLLGLFVDSALGDTSTHAGTQTEADTLGGQSTGAQDLCAKRRKNHGCGSTQTLGKQIHGGCHEGLKRGLDLLTHALILGILHDAGNLLAVFSGLGGHQAGQIILSALNGLRHGAVGAEGIGHHTHTRDSALCKT